MMQYSGTIIELQKMKSSPKTIYLRGKKSLLESKKISIVGSRKPTKYARDMIAKVAQALSARGACIVSGGAMGIDAIAHKSAGVSSTIAVLPCGLEHKYPSVNKKLLEEIEINGLLMSQFEPDFKATPWSFVVRNEIVVALGDVLIVAEADEGSGTQRSIEFAKKMGKKIYVLPHRIGDSSATQRLLAKDEAEAIYDIEAFADMFGMVQNSKMEEKDDFLVFCKKNPSYDEAIQKFSSRVFEAELSGEIEVKNSKIYLTK